MQQIFKQLLSETTFMIGDSKHAVHIESLNIYFIILTEEKMVATHI